MIGLQPSSEVGTSFAEALTICRKEKPVIQQTRNTGQKSKLEISAYSRSIFPEDQHLTPTPNPRIPHEGICVQPRRRWRFLLRSNLVAAKPAPTAISKTFTSLVSKENQVYLLRILSSNSSLLFSNLQIFSVFLLCGWPRLLLLKLCLLLQVSSCPSWTWACSSRAVLLQLHMQDSKTILSSSNLQWKHVGMREPSDSLTC